MLNRTLTVEGRVSAGCRVTCRVPYGRVAGLVPAGLEPVRRGDFGFVEVTCGRVEHLRPAGLPKPIGVGFNQAAYRVHVQAMTDRAEVVRGLYTLRTECDATLLGRLGNRLTGLRFCDAVVAIDEDDCHVTAMTTPRPHDPRAGLDLAVTNMPAALLPGSCFPTIADARAFCGYRPALLGVVDTAEGGRVLTRAEAARVDRACSETPAAIVRVRWGYFEELGLAGVMDPEWTVRVSPVAMRWTLGAREALLSGVRPIDDSQRDAARLPLNGEVALAGREKVKV